LDKKLTLSLNAAIIDEIKLHAKEQGTSLSRMVEGYFKYLLSQKQEEEIHQWSPQLQELMNAAEPSADYDEKEVITDYLIEKYK
jgi:hypothetical protein